MKKGSSTEPADSASKLGSLVHKNSNFEYEGFYWLKGNIKTIAKELDVTEKTIRRILENNKHNIRCLVKSPKGVPKYVLIRVGTGNCESDHVEFLRKIWVHGLVFFNTALEKNLTFKLENLNNIEFESENKREAYAKRLKKHITRANKG